MTFKNEILLRYIAQAPMTEPEAHEAHLLEGDNVPLLRGYVGAHVAFDAWLQETTYQGEPLVWIGAYEFPEETPDFWIELFDAVDVQRATGNRAIVLLRSQFNALVMELMNAVEQE